MNVNEYRNVQPENLFGYLGYGDDPSTTSPTPIGRGAVNFGLAHQFNQFYLGTWFGGKINGWTVKRNKDDGTHKDSTTTKHTDGSAAYGKILFGFGNMGIMANFAFQPDAANNSYEDDKEHNKKTTKNKFNVNTSVKFGINLEDANGRLYKTWAELGLDSRVAKQEVKKDGALETFDDGSIYTLNLNGGTSFDVYSANDITQSLDLELDTGWDFYAIRVYQDKDGSANRTGAFGMNIGLKPAWTLAYEPEDSQFGLKTKVGLEANIEYNQNYDKETSGSTMYNSGREYKTEIGLTPTLAAGAIYKVVPEKLQLNSGVTFKVPTGSWTNTKKLIRHTDGTVTSTKEDGTWTFDGKDGKIAALTTGFTWTPSEKVTIDANWNILEAVFKGAGTDTDFRTKFGTDFWSNINTLVFQNFGFLVAVKL